MSAVADDNWSSINLRYHQSPS